MPMDMFEKVLDDYSAMGGGALSLTPTVGDVLLDRRLSHRMDAIRQRPKIGPVSFTTNAVLAAKWNKDELASVVSGLRRIHVSIYGFDRAEYEQMSRRDRFSDMVAGIRRFIELRDKNTEIQLSFRLLKERSQDELSAWIRMQFGEELPFGAITHFANWGILDTSKPLPGDAKWIEIRYNKGQCLIPLIALQVSSDGSVSFCPCDDYQSVDELELGNVRDTSLLDMYNTEKVARLYDFASHVPQFCRTCSFWRPLEDSAQISNWLRDPTSSIGG